MDPSSFVTVISFGPVNIALPNTTSRLCVSSSFFAEDSRAVRTWAFLRRMTSSMLTEKPVVWMPKSALRFTRWATRPEARRVLVGVQPVLMHVPPIHLFSINAVFQPAAASFFARGLAACPEPMRMASYLTMGLYTGWVCPQVKQLLYH